MKVTIDKYYDRLKERGYHKYFLNYFDKYKKGFWLILVVFLGVLLWNGVFFKASSFWERVFVGLILLGMIRLGEIQGHKSGFIDGYQKGVDDMNEAYIKVRHKKITLDNALSEAQKEVVQGEV